VTPRLRCGRSVMPAKPAPERADGWHPRLLRYWNKEPGMPGLRPWARALASAARPCGRRQQKVSTPTNGKGANERECTGAARDRVSPLPWFHDERLRPRPHRRRRRRGSAGLVGDTATRQECSVRVIPSNATHARTGGVISILR
jgi:hypothetical protein